MKIPQRTCMGCNSKKNKSELIRIVRDKDGTVNIDKNGKMQGRGAYICENEVCLNKLMLNKKLERVLDVKISREIYDKLRGVIVGK